MKSATVAGPTGYPARRSRCGRVRYIRPVKVMTGMPLSAHRPQVAVGAVAEFLGDECDPLLR
jgi:hypothetical protein